GFIAKLDVLSDAARRLPHARVVPLRLGFAFLPITEEFVGEAEQFPFDILKRLTERLGAWAQTESVRCSLAYIETEDFGGIWTQGGVVWEGGRKVFGPEQSAREWVDRSMVEPPVLEKAINRALRLIGVTRYPALDEFDALGLGRRRSDRSWLAVTAGVDPRWSLAAVLHDLRPHEHWRGSFSEAYARAMESTEPGEQLQGWRTAAMILGDMHACLLCLLVCRYGRSLLPPESRDFLDHMDLCLWEMGLATPTQPGEVLRGREVLMGRPGEP